jgi:hypothetical protein
MLEVNSHKLLKLMETQINKIDFTGQNIYVGFDVHLKSWSIKQKIPFRLCAV